MPGWPDRRRFRQEPALVEIGHDGWQIQEVGREFVPPLIAGPVGGAQTIDEGRRGRGHRVIQIVVRGELAPIRQQVKPGSVAGEQHIVGGAAGVREDVGVLVDQPHLFLKRHGFRVRDAEPVRPQHLLQFALADDRALGRGKEPAAEIDRLRRRRRIAGDPLRHRLIWPRHRLVGPHGVVVRRWPAARRTARGCGGGAIAWAHPGWRILSGGMPKASSIRSAQLAGCLCSRPEWWKTTLTDGSTSVRNQVRARDCIRKCP